MAGIVEKNFLTHCWIELIFGIFVFFTAGHFWIGVADQWNSLSLFSNILVCGCWSLSSAFFLCRLQVLCFVKLLRLLLPYVFNFFV